MSSAPRRSRDCRVSPAIFDRSLGSPLAFGPLPRSFFDSTRVLLARRASRVCSPKSRRGSLIQRAAPAPEGVLLVDKPAGFTSHDVVAVVRGALASRRVGHLGTLDPFATGLLVLLIGRATRLARFIDGEPKVYEATIEFGRETDTDDSTGVLTREAAPPSAAAVDA